MSPSNPKYQKELDRLKARFLAMKHVVDYYFEAAARAVPKGEYEGHGSNYRLLDSVQSDESLSDPVVDAIAYHLACDGVHQDDLYDVESVLKKDDAETCGYAYVLIQCATRLRSQSYKFRRAFRSYTDCDTTSRDGKWFR